MSGRNPEDLNELEQALAGLRPAAAPFNRDRLLFEAGRIATQRRWLWPATSALTSALAAGLGLLLLLRPLPAPEVRVVYVDRPMVAPVPQVPTNHDPETVPNAAPVPPSSIWQLQQTAVRHGMDDAPEPSLAPAAASAGVVLSAWDWRPRPSALCSRFSSGVE